MDKNVVFKIFGNNIKKQRNKKNITLEELAKKSGIRKKYLIKIENGMAVGVSTSHLLKIAHALNIHPYILVEGL